MSKKPIKKVVAPKAKSATKSVAVEGAMPTRALITAPTPMIAVEVPENIGFPVLFDEAAPLAIVIGLHGWVWIGYYHAFGEEITITQTQCIRVWGTSKGLGELVDGPTDQTVLDPVGTLHLHRLSIVGIYRANEAAWIKSKKL